MSVKRSDIEEMIIHIARHCDDSDRRMFCTRLLILASGKDGLDMSRQAIKAHLYDPKVRHFMRHLFRGNPIIHVYNHGHVGRFLDLLTEGHIANMKNEDPIATYIFAKLVERFCVN